MSVESPQREPLHLKEYESRDVDLDRSQAELLSVAAGDRLRVGLTGADGTYRLTATSHVGVIVTPEVSVFIDPKVKLHNLFLLLGVAPPKFTSPTAAFGQDRDLLAVMAGVFITAVDHATLRGVDRGYRHTEERVLAPRGRIDLVEQLRRPATVTPIACRFDEYTADFFPNRAIVAALDRLHRVPGLPTDLRVGLNRLAPRFEDVQHVTVEPDAIDRWKPTRLNRHYEHSLRLAALILRNLTLTHRAGSTAAASFTVDMNVLFQDFVTDRLRRRLQPQLEVHAEPTVHLAAPRRLAMKPDLVFRRRRTDVYVGDTKYKLSSGPARISDYYQLLAYTTAMALDEGVLIYAQDPGDDSDPIGDERVHTVRIRNTNKVIHVYRVPLSGTNNEVEAALEELADWVTRQVTSPAGRAAA